jgi:hypothetical protein
MTARTAPPDPAKLAWSVQRLDLKPGESSYPARVSRCYLGYYSALHRAELVLERDAAENLAYSLEENEDDRTLCYDIIAYELDVQWQEYRIRHYAATGAFRYERKWLVGKAWPEFEGLREDDCSFRTGDLVELVHHHHLVVGIVSALPPSPELATAKPGLFPDGVEDAYCVLFAELHDHAHPDDGQLMPPRLDVPPAIAEKLRQHLAYFQGDRHP